ncbi:MAG: acyl-CoA dehydrogenase family protein [Dehalococcoidia bacterium]
MDFELSDEQELLRGGLRELLDRECEARRVRAVAYDGDGRDAELWQALAGAGWTAVTVPEADGGAGMRFEDVIVVLEEAGRALLPVPLTTTLLAARAIATAPESAARSDLLSRIVSGATNVTLALRGSHEDFNGERPGCAAERSDGGWRISGAREFVPHGPLAGVVLVDALHEHDGHGLFAVPTDAPGVSWTEIDVMDRTTRQYELALDGALAETSLFGDEDASDAIDRLLDEWRAALSTETLGAAQWLLELTVSYAQERVQFGQPIGSFQAVKARVAEMGGAVERMRAAVYHAAVKVDSDAPDRALAIAMAKAATAEPGAWVASQAIHVHGGVGYTWEHDVQMYFKRVKSNELLLGDTSASLARVADAVL